MGEQISKEIVRPACKKIVISKEAMAAPKKALSATFLAAAAGTCTGFITILVERATDVASNWLYYASQAEHQGAIVLAYQPDACEGFRRMFPKLKLFCPAEKTSLSVAGCAKAALEMDIPVAIMGGTYLFLKDPAAFLIMDGLTVSGDNHGSDSFYFFGGAFEYGNYWGGAKKYARLLEGGSLDSVNSRISASNGAFEFRELAMEKGMLGHTFMRNMVNEEIAYLSGELYMFQNDLATLKAKGLWHPQEPDTGGAASSASEDPVVSATVAPASSIRKGCKKIAVTKSKFDSDPSYAELTTALADAAEASCDGFITETIVSGNYACYLDNFLYYISKIDSFSPLVVICVDKAGLDACTTLKNGAYSKLSIFCARGPVYVESGIKNAVNDNGGKSHEYNRIMWSKTDTMTVATAKSIPILMADLDVLFFKNPGQYFQWDGRTVSANCEEIPVGASQVPCSFMPFHICFADESSQRGRDV